MEETRGEKLMGWIGDHKVISGIIFSLVISAIAGLGIKVFVNLMWPSEVMLEAAPVEVIPFSTGQYDEETTTGFAINLMEEKNFDICTVSSGDLTQKWLSNDVGDLAKSFLAFWIENMYSKTDTEEGSQITIPVGATKIDLELIKVYAWREVSDESASDYFVFLYHGDVGYLKRESIKDKTHITLLCGRE